MLKKSLMAQCALMVLFTLVLLWTVPATADDAAKNVYICGCGTAAKCNAVSDQPGNTPCGKPLIEKQVLKEDADNLYVCACADDCRCGLNQVDPAKCACGKELRAYPKAGKVGCAHGIQMGGKGGGCDKPCPQGMPADCGKNCAACPKRAAEDK